MRRKIAAVTAGMMVMTTSLAMAQSTRAPSVSERRIVSRVAPVYPDLAKRMHIHGIVRIQATVKPNGAVKSARVLGGNPVLVDAAVDAVGKWKFEPALAETTEVLQVTFDAD
jgi:TonB family protein